MGGKQASKVKMGRFCNECQARQSIQFINLDICTIKKVNLMLVEQQVD